MLLPKARTIELIEQNVDNEHLIYDLQINKAYSLNETSKNVFKACDGETSFDELKIRYQYTDDLIYLALDELRKNDLLEGDYTSPFVGMSRREVVRKVGLASMIALPVICALIAPDAINASSTCLQPGQSGSFPSSCSTRPTCNAFCNSQCCSGAAGPYSQIGNQINCQCPST